VLLSGRQALWAGVGKFTKEMADRMRHEVSTEKLEEWVAGGRRLKLDLLGDIESVFHLNPEISDGAFRLRKQHRVTKQ
jgi:hypothetical protein